MRGGSGGRNGSLMKAKHPSLSFLHGGGVTDVETGQGGLMGEGAEPG